MSKKRKSYSKAELNWAKQFVLLHAPKHTGTILSVPVHAQGPLDCGCASCVYIEYRGRRFSITCDHVTREASALYDLAIAPSDKPTPFGPVTSQSQAILLRRDTEHDLTVLDAQMANFVVAQKKPFPLETSDFISKEWLEQQHGLASFICGTWGVETLLIPMGQNRYVEKTFYSAGGPIKTVTSSTIIAVFEEKELLSRNDQVLPHLRGIRISGGSRDLSGMSGSGLWLLDENSIHLAGILTGPASGEIADPELRFTPVWVLCDLLQQVVDEPKSSI